MCSGQTGDAVIQHQMEGRRCKEEKRSLRRTAKQSQGASAKEQLLGKTMWFQGAGKIKNKNKYKGGDRMDFKDIDGGSRHGSQGQ